MSQAAAHGNPASRGHKGAAKKSLWARIIQFFKEVIAEFKKVQRPTRSELWKMFLTVVFFVAVVMAFVALVDLAFNQLVFWVFG